MKKLYKPNRWFPKIDVFEVIKETKYFFDYKTKSGGVAREIKDGSFTDFESARNALIKKYEDKVDGCKYELDQLHKEIDKAKILKEEQ